MHKSSIEIQDNYAKMTITRRTFKCLECKNYTIKVVNDKGGTVKVCNAKINDPKVIVDLKALNYTDYVYGW